MRPARAAIAVGIVACAALACNREPGHAAGASATSGPPAATAPTASTAPTATAPPAVIESVTPPPLNAAPRPAQLAHVTIKAIGMNCPESCPASVRSVLGSVAGIYEIGFDLDHEAVYISYDATLGAPKEFAKPMIAAIKSVGFDPWLAREDWPADAQALVRVVAPAS